MHFTDIPQPKSLVSKKRKSSDSLSESMQRAGLETDQDLESEPHFLSYTLNNSDIASTLYCHT